MEKFKYLEVIITEDGRMDEWILGRKISKWKLFISILFKEEINTEKVRIKNVDILQLYIQL